MRLGSDMCLNGTQTVLINNDYLAWTDISYKFSTDTVKCAGLGSDNIGIAKLADGKRSVADGVSCSNKLLRRHYHQRISALYPEHCLFDCFLY